MGRRRPGRWLAPFRPGRRIGESGQMLTSTECHEIAKQKLEQAEHEPQHRTRLLTAAQGWHVLENELRRLEANVIPPKASRRSRSAQPAAPLGTTNESMAAAESARGVSTVVGGIHEWPNLRPLESARILAGVKG